MVPTGWYAYYDDNEGSDEISGYPPIRQTGTPLAGLNFHRFSPSSVMIKLANEEGTMQDGQLSVGDTAPEIELPDTDGKIVRLSEFPGRPVVVSFLSHAA